MFCLFLALTYCFLIRIFLSMSLKHKTGYPQLLNGSCSAVFGILFSGFLTDHGASSSTTAWIQNLTFVLSNFCSYLLDPMVGEFGWRRVGIAMGLMNGCGLALSAFAISPAYLFFSYTFVAGTQ